MTAAARFDELIHPSTRLSIVAMLAATDWVEFAFLRDRLGLSDSALSKQLSTLEEAGYLTLERPVSDRRRRVRARLTPAGSDAFHGHAAALRAIVATGEPEATGDGVAQKSDGTGSGGAGSTPSSRSRSSLRSRPPA